MLVKGVRAGIYIYPHASTCCGSGDLACVLAPRRTAYLLRSALGGFAPAANVLGEVDVSDGRTI